MIEAGEYSTVSHGQDLLERHEAALAAMVGTGASRNPPVPITRMTEEERQARVTAMPNIAKAWADGLEAQGAPAADFMRACMDGLRARGEAPVRNRDEELRGLAVDGTAALGTLLIVGLMLIICADIVARDLFGGLLPPVSEPGALLFVMIVALQLAATIRADRLARTMAVLGPLGETRPRAAALLRAAYDLTGAAVIGGLTWATVSVLAKDWASGEFIGTPGLGTVPTWPFRALILLGLAIAALKFLRRAAAAVRWAAR